MYKFVFILPQFLLFFYQICYNSTMMEKIERYKHLNKYLKEKFGERTLKICIDGGFTCPNRDGTKGTSGCIFCSEKGSGEHIKNSYSTTSTLQTNTIIRNNTKIALDYCYAKISAQVKKYFQSYKAERANKFIAYFQNFTNTYDSLENLKKKYDAALIDERIVGLEVATRPDCITENIAELLKSYTNNYYVCVELGLQTANEETGNLINRCYNNENFTKAVTILNKYGIDVVTHIMLGLPKNTEETENHKDIATTVNFINHHSIQGLKIHSCYVVKNTKLEEMYLARKIHSFDIRTIFRRMCLCYFAHFSRYCYTSYIGRCPKRFTRSTKLECS